MSDEQKNKDVVPKIEEAWNTNNLASRSISTLTP